MLSILLFTNAEFHQLVKLPVLIEHFREHRRENPDISFLQFLRLHYLGKILVDDDYHRDQQLPMRDSEACQVILSCVCECPDHSTEQAPIPSGDKTFCLYRERNKPRFSVPDIFQPPRA